MLLLMDIGSKSPEGRGLRICCYLLASAVIYIAYPLTRDEPERSLRFCAVCSLYYVCASLLTDGAADIEYLFILPAAAFILMNQAGSLACKYKEPATVFRKDSAWCCAEEDSRSFFSFIIILFIIALATLCSKSLDSDIYLMIAALLFALDVALHIRAYTGRTVILSRKKERRIQTIMISNGRFSDLVPEVDDSILCKAYRRIEQFMREHKPYLDDRFTMDKMADVLKLNKVYISRSINKFTGKNFRQYVNWHRILYSVELMRSDPWLKVIELAFMSGFHSQVTFNMCFKVFMDETPSDMLSRLRLQKPRPEPSRIEVELPPAEVVPSSPDV